MFQQTNGNAALLLFVRARQIVRSLGLVVHFAIALGVNCLLGRLTKLVDGALRRLGHVRRQWLANAHRRFRVLTQRLAVRQCHLVVIGGARIEATALRLAGAATRRVLEIVERRTARIVIATAAESLRVLSLARVERFAAAARLAVVGVRRVHALQTT